MEKPVNIILTCGHPDSGYETAHEVLLAAGMAQAIPSRREELGPLEIQEKIFQAYEKNTSGQASFSQLSPGKVWQEFAADLIIANTAHETWGWADTGTVRLLDFWRENEPGTGFVFVYASPETAVAEALKHEQATPEQIRRTIASWTDYNTAVLKYYNRHRERCLLVNRSACVHDPGALVAQIKDVFGIALQLSGYEPERKESSAVAAMLAKSFIGQYREVTALYHELESTANLHGSDNAVREAENREAWQEYQTLVSKLEKGAAESNRQIESLAEKLRETQQSLDGKGPDADELSSKNAELTQENELLLLQLHQVQEELEQYFLQSRELQKQVRDEAAPAALLETFWRDQQPCDIHIDMRGDITGENWYEAEHDGRWAGPGEVSALSIPPLRNGRYSVTLDIVDALDPEIVTGMKVALNGTPLPFRVEEYRGGQVFIEAEITTEGFPDKTVWDIEFTFPKLVSPSETGDEDGRDLGIRLRSVHLHEVREDSGESMFFGPAVNGTAELIRNFWCNQQPLDVHIDMRREVTGDNWYEAETDGRWAGPGEVSTLSIPALRDGKYRLMLDIAESIDPEIVTGMELSLNGLPLPFSVEEYHGGPAFIDAEFSTGELGGAAVWEVRFMFPKLVSPSEQGEEDERKLTIRLKSLTLSSE